VPSKSTIKKKKKKGKKVGKFKGNTDRLEPDNEDLDAILREIEKE